MHCPSNTYVFIDEDYYKQQDLYTYRKKNVGYDRIVGMKQEEEDYYSLFADRIKQIGFEFNYSRIHCISTDVGENLRLPRPE